LSKRFRDRSCFQESGGTGSDFNLCWVTSGDIAFIDCNGNLYPDALPSTYEYPSHPNSVADSSAVYANPDAFTGSSNPDSAALSDLGCSQKFRGWQLARRG
jgi:hypothetical protein